MNVFPAGTREPRVRRCLPLLTLIAVLTPSLLRADEPPVRFEADVAPILRTSCLKCHGDGKLKGGLDLRKRAAILEGGDSGPALVPGKPADSLLVQRVEKGEMPPSKDAALDKRQVELIRRWVAQGAPFPSTEEAAKYGIASRVSAEDRRFWAFQSPKRPTIPQVADAARIRNPIDAFLLQKLEAKRLTFSPDASREVLLRRLCLDLLGLPPTPEQRAEFLADNRPGAYERLVDRLLALPEYGERWGRHWLDVAGYADSDGYLAADRLRPEAWRYRDYVIQALNDDVAFDRFVIEQLAGDELNDWRTAEKLTPEMTRQLTATGFLRTASDPTYPGYTEPNEIHQVVSDTMQIVGTTFLGLTMQCARCHEHKFDPISQRDYFALQTVLLPALDPSRWQPSEGRGIRLAPEKEWVSIQEHNRKIDERLQPLTKKLKELTAKRGKNDPPPETKGEVEKLKAEINEEQGKKKPVPPLVRGLADVPGKCPDGHVMQRGDYTKPGAVVAANVPEVLAPPGYALPIAPAHQSSGRRLALARWLTDPAHPLTARVQVNRMWSHHFGRGIVPTVANFGRSGARPTHPELLDWLATEFVRVGWSQKAMHRLMVTSTAYRQATGDSARIAADPKSELLSYRKPHRLEGEVVRDSVLAISGKLDGKRFGSPTPVAVRGDGSVDTNDDATGNRRSVYLIVRRSQHLTLLDLFDTPMMEINCPERVVSTVPLQALALFNSPFSQRNAEALADRLLKAASTDDDRLELAFRLAFSRDPRPSEASAIRRFLQAEIGERTKDAAAERAAWVQVGLVLLNSNEFVYAP